MSPGLFEKLIISKENQLDLFKDNIRWEFCWELFSPIVLKINKSLKYKSLCEDWWRSRYFETIICPGHQRNKRGFDFEQKAAASWKMIWKYKKHCFDKPPEIDRK